MHKLLTDPLLRHEHVRTDYIWTVNEQIRGYLDSVLTDGSADDLYWINTSDPVDLHVDTRYSGVANLQRLNDIRSVNAFFEGVNEQLPLGGYHIVCFETKNQRKERLLKKFPAVVNYLYYTLDFILKRIFPKWGPTRKIYHWLTSGRNRVITLTEGLGRLVSCGFTIVDYRESGFLTWVVTRKTSDPTYAARPTYGALCRLPRIGKEGKSIEVYKLRTMHPYSEFLQEFMYQRNALENVGKIRDDIRVTSWGKWFRKLWIDELPMLFNWLKGEMKWVGVRPLSAHYFNLYPKEVQELRMRVKRGLIPPFYADMPETLDEIIESEKNYLYAYLHKPFRTDLRYFFLALYNILIKGKRSR